MRNRGYLKLKLESEYNKQLGQLTI